MNTPKVIPLTPAQAAAQKRCQSITFVGKAKGPK